MYATPVQECPMEYAMRFTLTKRQEMDGEKPKKVEEVEKAKANPETENTEATAPAPVPVQLKPPQLQLERRAVID